MLRGPEAQGPFDAVLRLDGDHAIRGAAWKSIFPVGIRVGIVGTKNEGVNSSIPFMRNVLECVFREGWLSEACQC